MRRTLRTRTDPGVASDVESRSVTRCGFFPLPGACRCRRFEKISKAARNSSVFFRSRCVSAGPGAAKIVFGMQHRPTTIPQNGQNAQKVGTCSSFLLHPVMAAFQIGGGFGCSR